MCPMFKSGDKQNPSNYRGISLIDSLCKVFTSILTSRLQKWCEDNNIISECQAGFRSHYSTIDHIFSLSALVQKYSHKKKGRFYCVFIDFAKAFDTINHQVLFNSLRNIGITGKFYHVIVSMYSKLAACVRTPTGLTSTFKCNQGTRQGCILSPQLFIVFINTLITIFESCGGKGVNITFDMDNLYALMFADDVSGMADTALHLQKRLDALEQFCTQTGMKVNLDKTKIMVFRHSGPLRHYEKWFFEGKQLEVVSFYRYLGIVFTPRLSWTKAQDCLLSQGNKALMSIYSFQKKFGDMSSKDLFKLFDACIMPILCYGSEVWGVSYCKNIENFQAKVCRWFLKVGRNVSSCMALGECGRLPLQFNYTSRAVKYWCKLIRLDAHTRTAGLNPKMCN